MAGGVAVLLAVLGVLTVALWPERGPAARSRQYRDVTACLLTGSAGVTTVEAAPVWAGMREASEGTGVKVRFLEVDGAQTAENAAGYLAGLLGGGCDVIFAVGQAPGAALTKAAVRYPRSRFVLVTAAATTAAAVEPGGLAGNVMVVGSGDPVEVRERVRRLVVDLVGVPVED